MRFKKIEILKYIVPSQFNIFVPESHTTTCGIEDLDYSQLLHCYLKQRVICSPFIHVKQFTIFFTENHKNFSQSTWYGVIVPQYNKFQFFSLIGTLMLIEKHGIKSKCVIPKQHLDQMQYYENLLDMLSISEYQIGTL